jgi:hypothetical protein
MSFGPVVETSERSPLAKGQGARTPTFSVSFGPSVETSEVHQKWDFDILPHIFDEFWTWTGDVATPPEVGL